AREPAAPVYTGASLGGAETGPARARHASDPAGRDAELDPHPGRLPLQPALPDSDRGVQNGGSRASAAGGVDRPTAPRRLHPRLGLSPAPDQECDDGRDVGDRLEVDPLVDAVQVLAGRAVTDRLPLEETEVGRC